MLFDVSRTNIILYCQNWHEMVRFYKNVMELSINFQTDWFVEFRINANAFLSVADQQKATIKSASGEGITLSWRVNNFAAAYEKLTEKNIVVSDPMVKWAATICYFADPEGNRIELWDTL